MKHEEENSSIKNKPNIHKSVLTEEVIEYLDPKPNENFVDATLGVGGHTEEILKRNAFHGKVLGIELEKRFLEEREDKERLVKVKGNFKNLKKIVEEKGFKNIKGVLLDLGISSWHLEKSKKGFSFQKEEELDMRLDDSQSLTAKEIVNTWPREKIEEILKKYGEEKFAKRITKNLIESRKEKKIETTSELVEIIKDSVPKKYKRKPKKHFATRSFQALRIAVNGELENLRRVLPQALEVLQEGGRIVVISFHSLEDRIVKHFFKEKGEEGKVKILTKKPVTASEEEKQANRRARSAKLRAVEKLPACSPSRSASAERGR